MGVAVAPEVCESSPHANARPEANSEYGSGGKVLALPELANGGRRASKKARLPFELDADLLPAFLHWQNRERRAPLGYQARARP